MAAVPELVPLPAATRIEELVPAVPRDTTQSPEHPGGQDESDTVNLSSQAMWRYIRAAAPAAPQPPAPLAIVAATPEELQGRTGGVLVSFTTASGLLVSLERYGSASGQPGQSPDSSRPTDARSGYLVRIGASEAEQGYFISTNVLITTDENGAAHLREYTEGSETAGDDVIIAIRAAETGLALNGGAGDDTIVALAGAATSITGGDGNDTIILPEGMDTVTIDTGDGDDTITAAHLGRSGQARVNTGSGDDTVTIGELATRGGQADIVTGDGNDAVTVRGSANYGGQTRIDTGGGDDTVSFGYLGSQQGQLRVDTGSGNDTVKGTALLGQAQLDVRTGDGDDALRVMVGGAVQARMDTGDGNDTLDIDTVFGGQLSVDAGSGDDTINLGGLGVPGITGINTGDGNDTLNIRWFSGYGLLNIDTGDGDDTVNALWFRGEGQDIRLRTGNGDDTVNSDWSGAILADLDNQMMRNLVREVDRLGDTLADQADAGRFLGRGSFVIDTGSGDDAVNASWTGVGAARAVIDTGSGNDGIQAHFIGTGVASVEVRTGDGDDATQVHMAGKGTVLLGVDPGDGADAVRVSQHYSPAHRGMAGNYVHGDSITTTISVPSDTRVRLALGAYRVIDDLQGDKTAGDDAEQTPDES
ncbi:hypothetical protein [Nitratidesulfovibrio termitidis]|uniref:hypothetical protein n=1 Tax=Nitratidesulfovibrio termitidis TaxID=42252 RepID=UPI00041E1D9B|nr:hypothetical protein [Nitratidesulfovibrio termitidis]